MKNPIKKQARQQARAQKAQSKLRKSVTPIAKSIGSKAFGSAASSALGRAASPVIASAGKIVGSAVGAYRKDTGGFKSPALKSKMRSSVMKQLRNNTNKSK